MSYFLSSGNPLKSRHNNGLTAEYSRELEGGRVVNWLQSYSMVTELELVYGYRASLWSWYSVGGELKQAYL